MSGGTASEIEARLARYVDEIRRLGPRLNLVGSLEPEEIRVHIADSLAGAVALRAGARVVDLGSGAGFPGLPLAIARPDVDVTLVEIRERRVHFLRHAVRTCGLSCRVVRTKIEDVAGRFDFALARALASPEKVMQLAAPWLLPDGELWLWTRETSETIGRSNVTAIEIGADRGRILRIPAENLHPGALSADEQA